MKGKNGYRKGELRRDLRAKLEQVFGSELSSRQVLEAVPTLRKRLYKTKEPRNPAAKDVLYILLRYVRGEPAKELARLCKEARLSGFSSTSIEIAARRVTALPEQATAQTLMECLQPPDRHAGKLSKILVDRLDAAAGEASGLPEEIRWRRWHLVEITFLVRTGLWPPRIVLSMIPEELNEWETMPMETALRAARVLSGEPGKSDTDALRHDWEQLRRTADKAGVLYQHAVIAENISREAVRVALNRGVRPHRWIEPKIPSIRKISPYWEEIPEQGRPPKKDAERLQPPDRHAGKLSRILVERLDAAAGEVSGLPEELQWRRWHLVEIAFFVRTGLWPPWIIFQQIPQEKLTDWQPLNFENALWLTRSVSRRPKRNDTDDFREYWELLQKLADDAGLPYRHAVIAENISCEAVRVALKRGVRPHRWIESKRPAIRKLSPYWEEIPKRGRPPKKDAERHI